MRPFQPGPHAGAPYAGALADPAERAARHALLRTAPHTAPIRALAARIRAATGHPVPEPDPLDGGARARLLLLLETPGPRVLEDPLVSRDKPGGTGANLRRFLAAIPRDQTLIWNAIPWIIHAPGALNRAPRAAERRAGLAWIAPLLDALPHLRVAVLAGRHAAAAEPAIRAARPDVAVLTMPHPSPTYVCTSPAIPARIAAVLAEAAGCLQAAPGDVPRLRVRGSASNPPDPLRREGKGPPGPRVALTVGAGPRRSLAARADNAVAEGHRPSGSEALPRTPSGRQSLPRGRP